MDFSSLYMILIYDKTGKGKNEVSQIVYKDHEGIWLGSLCSKKQFLGVS